MKTLTLSLTYPDDVELVVLRPAQWNAAQQRHMCYIVLRKRSLASGYGEDFPSALVAALDNLEVNEALFDTIRTAAPEPKMKLDLKELGL